MSRVTPRRHDLVLQDEPSELRSWAAQTLAAAAAMDPGERRPFLVERGLAAPHYPRPYGIEAGPVAQIIIAQEFERAGLAQPTMVIGEWAVPTILAHGTDEQRETFVKPSLRGEIAWCQLFSEPGAGSDLASLRTRAAKVDGGWRLNGQKVWTSQAAEADWAICLARTDPEVASTRASATSWSSKNVPKDLPSSEPVSVTLHEMDRFGIEIGVIGVSGSTSRAALKRHPDRFVPTGSIDDPNDVSGTVGKVRQEYEEFGIRAVGAFPAGTFPVRG